MPIFRRGAFALASASCFVESLSMFMMFIWLCIGLGTVQSSVAQAVDVVPGEVLVRLRGGAAKAALVDSERALRSLGARGQIEPLFSSSTLGRAKRAASQELLRWYRVSIDPQLDPVTWSARAVGVEGIEWAQPNYLRRYADTASDSLRGQQWALGAIGWRADVEADSVVVAVIDSGVDYVHPDLAGQIWHNRGEVGGVEGVDDDGNGYVDDLVGWDFSDAPGLPGQGDYLTRDADPSDESGHGTHVAGIIAAGIDNGIGIAGVASNARIMVLRAGFNLPSGGYLQDDDIAAAMVYAVDNGADIINMSWGDPRPAPMMRDVVRYADGAGVVMVAAAGNEGEDAVFYPARFAETIAVGASAPEDQVLAFSNYGPSIDVVAPGSAVMSLLPKGRYGLLSGTSMAAPHVAGLVALLVGRQPQWDADLVRGALRATARDALAEGWDARSGAGLVHFDALAPLNPPLVRIVQPEQERAVDGREVELTCRLADVGAWTLEWGAGLRPSTWRLIGEGAGVASIDTVLHWDLTALADGVYELRLRGAWGATHLEDRVRVRVQRTAATVLNLRTTPLLKAGQWRQVVEWETLGEHPAYLVVERAGMSVHEERVERAAAQRVLLPSDLPSGTYAIKVHVPAVGEGTTAHLERVEVRSERVEHWPLGPQASLPAGYLMPESADANGDGQAELVQMGYGSAGQQYNAVDYYQRDGHMFSRIFSSLQLYIPWNIQDADGDGLVEMLGVDAQRVRLFEAPAAGAFPRQLVWEQGDVWGGEVADLDGDGAGEFILRSSRGDYFQVFEAEGDNAYREKAVINRTSAGSNELGQRQVVGDLDGDGRGELIGGDGDGDLFVFEAIADGAYRATWSADGTGDARTVGGGGDLDGDGDLEFVVARFFDDPYDLDARRWELEVYGAVGNDDYILEWQAHVAGTTAGGSGINWGDLNGDGRIEWALVVPPDTYVFASSEPNLYEPVWHGQAAATYRPFIGDLDADGRDELAFNTAFGTEIYRHPDPLNELRAPAALDVYPLGGTQVQVEWQAVVGALGYHIYRDGVLVGQTTETTFTDGEATESGRSYRYGVRAVGAMGLEGPSSREEWAVPQERPRMEQVRSLSGHQIAVDFSQAMRWTDIEPYRFRLEPAGELAASVVFDRGGKRAVLGFAGALPDSGAVELVVRGLRGQSGAPLERDRFSFMLAPVARSARLLRAEVQDAYHLVLYFDKPVQGGLDRASVRLGDGAVVKDVQAQGNQVWVTLAGDRGLRPLGRSYRVVVDGLLDEDGLVVRGEASFVFAAADLSGAAPFPNPYRPERGVLTFGLLPAAAAVEIYDVGGRLVRRLIELDGDGGVQWNGENQAGRPLAAGMYFYRITAGGQSKIGSLALVR